MEKEIWKPIPNYEGIYVVSNQGRVKSLTRKIRCKCNAYLTHKESILKGTLTRKGYRVILLSKNCKNHIYKLHRLVAMAFVPNPNNYKEINHKNENKDDNRADNLEWCTRSYNIHFGTGLKRRIESQKTKVLCHENNKIYSSIKDAALDLGICRSGISQVILGNKEKHCGYHFSKVQ